MCLAVTTQRNIGVKIYRGNLTVFRLSKGQALCGLSTDFCNDSRSRAAADSLEELEDALVGTIKPNGAGCAGVAPSVDAVCAAAIAAATEDRGGLVPLVAAEKEAPKVFE